MSAEPTRARRDANWYLRHDAAALIRGLEARHDELTIEEAGLRRLAHRATVERMERLGLLELASRYRDPPPYPAELELYASRHPTLEETVAFDRERKRQRARNRGKRTPPDPAKLGEGEVVTRRVGTIVGLR